MVDWPNLHALLNNMKGICKTASLDGYFKLYLQKKIFWMTYDFIFFKRNFLPGQNWGRPFQNFTVHWQISEWSVLVKKLVNQAFDQNSSEDQVMEYKSFDKSYSCLKVVQKRHQSFIVNCLWLKTRIDKESIFGPSKFLRLWLGLGCDKMLDKNVTHLRLDHITHRL